MLVRKKVDYYPIAAILVIFAIDLAVFSFSSSLLVPLIWATCTLNIKGWVCAWNHHHQHCSFFPRLPWANRTLELIMGLQTGAIGESWVLHHTLGHHLNYLDQTKDESSWTDSNGRMLSHLVYSCKVTLLAYPIAWKVGNRYPKSQKKLLQNALLTALVLSLLAWINLANTLIIFVVPMLILLFMTVHVTYDHHAGLDTDNPYQATYNITNRWYNLVTCNLGYHTAHHLQCGRHWSELPQLHEEIKDKIPAQLYVEAGLLFSLMEKAEEAIAKRKKSLSFPQ